MAKPLSLSVPEILHVVKYIRQRLLPEVSQNHIRTHRFASQVNYPPPKGDEFLPTTNERIHI